MTLPFPTHPLRAQKFYLPFKTRKQPKQGQRSNSVISYNDGRFDRFGANIKKGGKQKVTFKDQVTTEQLITVHRVQSYKKYNVLTVKEKGPY